MIHSLIFHASVCFKKSEGHLLNKNPIVSKNDHNNLHFLINDLVTTFMDHAVFLAVTTLRRTTCY
jgi:hypothetical protein